LPAAAAGEAAQSTSAVTVPDLAGTAVLIAASSEIEAPLLARRLAQWGAQTRTVADAQAVAAAMAEQRFDTILVDHALGLETCRRLAGAATPALARRIILITPAERHELPALQAAGFTDYLVKPIRAASLATRLGAPMQDFDRSGGGKKAAVMAPPAGDALSILIAEDNEINALLARALLERLGHRATVVFNGVAAVEAWRAARIVGEPYDLVLMDVQMPGGDGIEATLAIRAAEGDGPRIPIIALTADALSEDRNACLGAGMDGFLSKPLDRDRFAELLAGLRRTALAA
jgi:CheY-like chemotaxis protein